MEALRRTWRQFAELYGSMAPSQRGTLLVIPLMVLGAFYLLVFKNDSSSYVALSWGKVFTSEELVSAEQTLIEAGLANFERRGQRIMVPQSDVERANAALLEAGTLPENSTSELERQLQKASFMTPATQLQAMMDVALKKELGNLIQAVPDVERAGVTIARPSKRRWNGSDAVTATVSVLPRRGRELSSQLVQSIRWAVASGVPDLKPENVTVLDQSKGIAHKAEQHDDPFDSRLLVRKTQFEERFQSTIAAALAHIPDVQVTVSVDLDNIKSSVMREQTVKPKETVSLQQSEQTRTDVLSEQMTRAEPGVIPNAPQSLETQGGDEKRRNLEERTSSSTVAASFSISEQEFVAAVPKAVQVSIGIPHDYFRNVALKQGLSDGETDEAKAAFQAAVTQIQQKEEENARQTARTLLPGEPPDSAIDVRTIFPIDPEVTEVEVPLTDNVANVVSNWGGAIGLTCFALWALWMLNRSTPRIPEEILAAPQKLAIQRDEDGEAAAQQPAVQLNERDRLQTVVRDNPEMAAAVLRTWIESDK
jgi:flagellar M-ring protein FliF